MLRFEDRAIMEDSQLIKAAAMAGKNRWHICLLWIKFKVGAMLDIDGGITFIPKETSPGRKKTCSFRKKTFFSSGYVPLVREIYVCKPPRYYSKGGDVGWCLSHIWSVPLPSFTKGPRKESLLLPCAVAKKPFKTNSMRVGTEMDRVT